MNDTFSFHRLYGLFKWQLAKMDWRIFTLISLLLVFLIYSRVRFYSPRLNEFSSLNTYFIFSIVVVLNFFKQLTNKESMAQFLILPSSMVEKFVFIAGGALFIPMFYFFGLTWIGDTLGHEIYPIPSSYHVLSFSSGSYIFFIATVAFFIHCLKQSRWMWGVSSLFIPLMLIIFIKSYFRYHPLEAAISDMVGQYLPVVAVISSVVLLAIAFRLFNVNEIARFNNYWKR